MSQVEDADVKGGGFQLVRKVLITATTGGITFLLTNLADQSAAWSLLLSLLIGGITFLVQFLADLEKREHMVEMRLASLAASQSRMSDELRQVVRQEIAKTGEAAELFDRLQRSPIRNTSIERLVLLAADMADSPPDLARSVAQTEIDSAVSYLEQLAHSGEIAYDGEDRDWLLALTRAVVRSIDAISRGSAARDGQGFVDEGFWDSELSNRYLEWQRQAIRRGVAVRRLFVLENAPLRQDREFRRICDQQREIGIVVRVLDASELSSSRRLLLPDLVLFDEQVSYELTAAPRLGGTTAPYFVKTRLIEVISTR